MIKTGDIKAFERITTGAETTPEFMRNYVKNFADILCATAGNLQIVESRTEEHEKGVFYYICEIGSDYPILCVGNTQNSSYWYQRIFVGCIRADGEPYFQKNGSSSTTGSITINCAGYNTFMNYIKSDQNFVFGFREESKSQIYNMLLAKVKNETEIKTTLSNIDGSYISSSFVPGFSLATVSVESGIGMGLRKICPETKEIIADIYIGGNEKFVNLKYFTNRANILNRKITIGNKTYVVIVVGSANILLELE